MYNQSRNELEVNKLSLQNYHFIYFCECVSMCMEVRGQLAGFSSLLPCGLQDQIQAWPSTTC